MIIFPAIDIINGQCVRLLRGDYSTAKKVAEDPLETARKFEAAGAKWLHTVDLDGAAEGRPVNTEIYRTIARETTLNIQLGGGIRSLETIESYLNLGVARVILGSAALKNPEFAAQAIAEFGGERVAVGIDAKNGMAAAEGWREQSQVSYLDLAVQMAAAGARYIIYTDIEKDGTLSGVSLAQLRTLSESVDCNLIASGGVRSLVDIKALKDLNVYGVVCGKSLYEGTLRLEDALEEASRA